jgi:hypothetical protein
LHHPRAYVRIDQNRKIVMRFAARSDSLAASSNFTRAVAVSALLGALTSPSLAAEAKTGDPLFEKVSSLDTATFDAFNHCSEPGQIEKHAKFFAPDIEFYHDTGGVTWTRDAMLGLIKKNVCGNFRRELVPGSLRVYPIKDFGAIEQGVHRFCQFKSGECEGMADFVLVWRNKGGKWQVTRVLSYGHRANE